MGEWGVAVGKRELSQLTRAHRVLIGVVVFGAIVIAGMGFGGSYTAVRELALKQGFGSFSYVFPVGIDAGICVLLALDLLLTWIRIPFPLLRQTAWLLTAATVAFNGAAAWPDPLGVGMHAVIPVLFVVAVEAARHAIGRIADITADKQMEGVRLTRWILSPGPTFLLWRRMKLWELRSYEKVIKLEQERLVYQASLRSRFGRGWRRKAPIEALMPLRLARYGIPLAQTAPAGLAAAGIEEPPILFSAERDPAPRLREDTALDAAAEHGQPAAELDSTEAEPAQTPGTELTEQPQESAAKAAERFAEAYQAFLTQFQAEPTPTQWAYWLRDTYGISTGSGAPLAEGHVRSLLQVLQARYVLHTEEPAATEDSEPVDQRYDYFHSAWRTYALEHGAYPDAAALAVYGDERDSLSTGAGRPITGDDLADFVASFEEHELGSSEPPPSETAADPGEHVADKVLPEGKSETALADAGAQAAKEQRIARVHAAIDGALPEDDGISEGLAGLTTVDRYYLAWMEYRSQSGSEAQSSTREAEELSTYLASKGMRGRADKPVSPATLRRYLLAFRVYTIWAEQRVRNAVPSLDTVAQECAAQGISAQYNKPLRADYLAEQTVDFERRWQALVRHHADARQ